MAPAMTVLYRLDAAAAAIAARFGAVAGHDPWAGGTIAPGRFAPVLTMGREFVAGPGRADQPLRMIPRLWGVPPPPNAGDPVRGVLTVRNPGSPFWIGNLRNSEFRCLVPATALMVWGRVDPATGRRRQHWLACPGQPVFAMAGVWKDSEVPSFALLTTEANALWRGLGHDAMPAILPGDGGAWRTWLRADWKRAAELLAPYPSSQMAQT
ncbi:SOS response-associated peptidase family protein [Novosphingobium sp.]|uniref:SOS response-associated peptidase family protein n=1 Tax=Novosphingobium sp. TaxID=1874826 RepID=UPI0025DA8686|nr:SOS response-associated peptidase family protein [Novosphingobium sp.]